MIGWRFQSLRSPCKSQRTGWEWISTAWSQFPDEILLNLREHMCNLQYHESYKPHHMGSPIITLNSYQWCYFSPWCTVSALPWNRNVICHPLWEITRNPALVKAHLWKSRNEFMWDLLSKCPNGWAHLCNLQGGLICIAFCLLFVVWTGPKVVETIIVKGFFLTVLLFA